MPIDSFGPQTPEPFEDVDLFIKKSTFVEIRSAYESIVNLAKHCSPQEKTHYLAIENKLFTHLNKETQKVLKNLESEAETLIGKNTQQEMKKLAHYIQKVRKDIFSMNQQHQELNPSADTIFQLINTNDTDKLRELIASGLDINIKNQQGDTPLVYALKVNHTDSIRILLKAPNLQVNKELKSLLEHYLPFTLSQNQIELSKDIFRFLDFKDEESTPYLVKAAKAGDIRTILLLIEAGADINEKDIEGLSPFMTAFLNNDHNLANAIAQHKDFDPLKNIRGLDIAYQKRDWQLVKVFLMKCPSLINEFNTIGILNQAIQNQDKKTLGAWISILKDLDSKTLKNYLQQAIKENQHIVFHALVDQNPDKVLLNNMLRAAAKEGKFSIAEILLKAGADMNAVNQKGESPLLLAIANNKSKTLHFLMECNPKEATIQNALVFALDKNTHLAQKMLQHPNIPIRACLKTLDHIATGKIKIYDKSVLNALVDKLYSFDKGLLYKYLETAVDSSQHPLIEAIVLKLDFKDENNEPLIVQAARYNDSRLFHALYDIGVQLNIKNSQSQTTLMWAITNQNKKMINNLLRKKVNVNSRDISGYTALMLAASKGDLSTVKALIGKGAGVNITSNKNATALMIAAKNGNHQIVEFLIKNGANITLENIHGKTAMMIAQENGHDDLALLLDSKKSRKDNTSYRGSSTPRSESSNPDPKTRKKERSPSPETSKTPRKYQKTTSSSFLESIEESLRLFEDGNNSQSQEIFKHSLKEKLWKTLKKEVTQEKDLNSLKNAFFDEATADFDDVLSKSYDILTKNTNITEINKRIEDIISRNMQSFIICLENVFSHEFQEKSNIEQVSKKDIILELNEITASNLPLSASNKEISTAFKKAKFKFHPDRNGNAEVFKEISNLAEIWSGIA